MPWPPQHSGGGNDACEGHRSPLCLIKGQKSSSGIQDHRVERNKVMALAQARQIDAILVTELTRWGRSTMDLVHTLHTLQARGVSLIAQTGWQFDLSTPPGRVVCLCILSVRLLVTGHVQAVVY
jgi:DNA invertase Pin-like site-specific DNA recombinase